MNQNHRASKQRFIEEKIRLKMIYLLFLFIMPLIAIYLHIQTRDEVLNSFNENTFDREFDQYEIEYYKQVAINKPHIAHNLNGWIYRARYVTNELYQNSNFMIA